MSDTSTAVSETRFQKRKRSVRGVIANQVQRNPHQPGQDRAVSAEAAARRPGSNEGVLGQRLRHIAVADRDQMKAEDPLLVGGHNRVHIVERSGLGLGDDRLPRERETIGAESL